MLEAAPYRCILPQVGEQPVARRLTLARGADQLLFKHPSELSDISDLQRCRPQLQERSQSVTVGSLHGIHEYRIPSSNCLRDVFGNLIGVIRRGREGFWASYRFLQCVLRI